MADYAQPAAAAAVHAESSRSVHFDNIHDDLVKLGVVVTSAVIVALGLSSAAKPCCALTAVKLG